MNCILCFLILTGSLSAFAKSDCQNYFDNPPIESVLILLLDEAIQKSVLSLDQVESMLYQSRIYNPLIQAQGEGEKLFRDVIDRTLVHEFNEARFKKYLLDYLQKRKTSKVEP